MKRLLLLLLLCATATAFATVPDVAYSVSFTCTGSTGPFPFTFPTDNAAAISVTMNGAVVPASSYTVVPINASYTNGGTVTLNAMTPCQNGWVLIVARKTPITQVRQFYDNMPVPMKTFEQAVDKLTEIDQEIWGGTLHSIQWQNNGANVDGPMRGDAVVNVVGCLVQGATNNFILTCVPGSGGSSTINIIDPTLPPYNCACNGVTNDTACMQSAINAAQAFTAGNSPSRIASPQGRACMFADDLVLAASGTTNIDIGGFSGPGTSQGSGMRWVATNGAAITINPSVLGNGLGVNLHDFTLDCNLDGTDDGICPSLIKIGSAGSFGSTFGPINIERITSNGHHDSANGDGSHGAQNFLSCASHCSIQVRAQNNNLENFSGTIIDLANSINSGGTNITIKDNQFFDAPKGVKVASSGPVQISGNYFELFTHAVEITNNASWTLGQYHIYGNEFNLERIPPYNDQTNTGAQRAIYITNQDGGVATMTALLDIHDNKFNQSNGYVLGTQGISPYAIETNLACGAFCYSVMIDSHNNYFAGTTTSGIRANVGFGWVTSYHDLVTADLQPYETASNLPSITGSYIGNPGIYDPNTDSAVNTQFLVGRTNLSTPIAQVCILATDQKGCKAVSPYMQLSKPADNTHFAGWSLFDNDNPEKSACGAGGSLISGGVVDLNCANSYQWKLGNVKQVGLRNTINSTDHILALNASDALTLDGVAIAGTLPDPTGHEGEFLGVVSGAWAPAVPPGGGDVGHSGTSTTNHVTCFASGSGTLINDCGFAKPGSNFVGINDTQTLTNKSIAGSEINSGVIGATYGGTGQNFSAATGIAKWSSGTASMLTGTQAKWVGFNLTGVPTSVQLPVYSGELLGLVGDNSTDNCSGGAMAAALAVVSAVGPAYLQLPMGNLTKLTSCDLDIPANVIILGSNTWGANKTPASTPKSGLHLVNAGAQTAPIIHGWARGMGGLENVYVINDSNNRLFAQFTCMVPHLVGNMFVGRRSATTKDMPVTGNACADGGVNVCPDNDGVQFGYPGATGTYCDGRTGSGSAGDGFDAYGMNVIRDNYFQNMRRWFLSYDNANGIEAVNSRGDYTDADIDPSYGSPLYMSGTNNSTYSNRYLGFQVEMANFTTGSCNYPHGMVRLANNALNNVLDLAASDLGSCTIGGYFIDNSTSGNNKITIGGPLGSAICGSDVGSGGGGTQRGNIVECLYYKEFTSRYISATHIGNPATHTATSGLSTLQFINGGVLGWDQGSNPWACDVGLSRGGTGAWMKLGNCTNGDTTGRLDLTTLNATGTATIATVAATTSLKLTAKTFATLDASPVEGEMQFCSDCKVTTAAGATGCSTAQPASCVCTSGGTGAYAKRMNYVSNGVNWYCQ